MARRRARLACTGLSGFARDLFGLGSLGDPEGLEQLGGLLCGPDTFLVSLDRVSPVILVGCQHRDGTPAPAENAAPGPYPYPFEHTTPPASRLTVSVTR